jgi:predicted metalloprotease with PDZ domain
MRLSTAAVAALVLCSSFSVAQTSNSKARGVQPSKQMTQAAGKIDLSVDATEASRKILHVVERVSATAGDFTLAYPEWIPGEHGPTGPVIDLVGVHVFAGERELPWTRDKFDMYSIHVAVPAGSNDLTLKFDQLLPSNAEGFSAGASSTANLAMVSWNQVVLAPKGMATDSLQVAPHLKYPAEWRFATGLRHRGAANGSVDFETVSLTTLVDSPVLMGRYFREIPLGNDLGKDHFIDLVADSDAALQMPEATIAQYKQFIRETGALWGARHYRDYRFLVTLSDSTAHFGLEHHESSDDRLPERNFVDDEVRWTHAALLTHEMTHSWNGKYRRPTGLATPNYSDKMTGELLWVYEGMTQYWGNILAARSGLWTKDEFLQQAAEAAAVLDHRSGRTWRPLQDTATEAQLLYGASHEWENYRRSVDYYDEGFLLWLEADTIIRRESHGQKSLDDFCKRFEGAPSTGPVIVPYTFDDIVSNLNAVQPYDWRGFWTERLNSKSARAPLAGFENGGWKLTFSDKMPLLIKTVESERKVVDARYSLGMWLKDSGEIVDVILGSPAEKAGISPGMKLVAVNGRAFKDKVLHDEIKATKNAEKPMELIVANGEFFKTYRVDYRGGEQFPIFVRDESKPDVLSDIIAAHAK